MENKDRPLEYLFQNSVHSLNHSALNSDCQRWALTHGKLFSSLVFFCFSINLFKGFVQRNFTRNDDNYNDSNVTPYPFTIYPSPYPHSEYERACQIQYAINRFVQNLASDIDLMDSIFKKLIKFQSKTMCFVLFFYKTIIDLFSLIECDPFIRRLRTIYDEIQQLPYKVKLIFNRFKTKKIS